MLELPDALGRRGLRILSTRPRTRHVWVKLDHQPIEHPGFVLDWRRTDTGWDALVTYYVEADRCAFTTWLEAHRLRPVESTPSIGSAYG